MPARTKILILCYHSIADHRDDPVLADYSIPRERLVKHLDSLCRRGFHFVDGSAVLEALRNGRELPRKPVLITFDDGYAELLEIAREVLRPTNIPAVAFVVTGHVGQSNLWDQPGGAQKIDLLGWDQLRQLQQAGVEIGGHSIAHPHLTRLADCELERQVAGCLRDIEAHGLGRPRFLAYPFGDCDPRVTRAAKGAGFEAAFGLADRFATGRSDPFDIERIEMSSRDTPFRFWLKTAMPRLARLFRTGLFRRVERLLTRRSLVTLSSGPG